MNDRNRLVVLVDGSSYLFRAYHALPKLSSNRGHPTGALHGVIKMLAKLYDDYRPTYLGIVFDARGKNFRHQISPNYKANRAATPDDLQMQIAPLHQLIRALGFTIIIEEGVEADDVIGTLATRALAQHYEVIISSGDKDMTQLLINDDITLLDTMNDKIITNKNVATKFKVDHLRADQVADFLALMGDSADNIVGVAKVGAKTAAKWLQQYDNLDNIINNAAEIGGKVGENLRQSLTNLQIARQLTTINTSLPLTITMADLAPRACNVQQLAQLCDEYGLNDIKARYAKNAVVAPQVTRTRNYHCLQSLQDVDELLARLCNCARFAIDSETTSLNYRCAKLVGISIALIAGEAYYLPLAHDDAANLPFAETLERVKTILENEKIAKIGQNLKYDRHIFARYGIALAGCLDDTMLMSYCYNCNATRHNLDALALHYLNIKTISYEEVAGKGSKQISFAAVNLEQATVYACEDADITLQLWNFFSDKLQALPSLNKLYFELENPLATVLWQMENCGVCIDGDNLRQLSKQLAQQLQDIETQAQQMAGEDFNLSSPKQLQTILFEKMQLPILATTAGGQATTNEETLAKLAALHPLPALILNYRSLAKLKSSYSDKLPQLIDGNSQRLHTSYHQAVTITGRLSSSEPNLQNIPVRSADGKRIRQSFIAPRGKCILSADYSQIELRLMAHFSRDEALLEAFAQEIDIHSATAAEIFACAVDEVTPQQRRHAKAINFGLIYGMSAFGLAKQLAISRSSAANYIERYFDRYRRVQSYMREMHQFAADHGYVETILGRRIYLDDINNKNAQRRFAAQRLAVNAPVQGSAADIIKMAMLAIAATKDDSATLLLQVHDELVFEVAANNVAAFSNHVKDKMENAIALDVNLLVNIGVGQNWDEAH